MSGFIDPAISRKEKIVNEKLTLSELDIVLPSVVEISESGTCNRVCSFCPRSDPNFPDIKKFIEPRLLNKLLLELAEYNYSGIFLFSGFVEPLLDKKIFDHVAMVREILPQARIEMVTNGDVLNEKRLTRLFESGLNTLLISAYDSKEQADDFVALCQKVGLRDDQFVVRARYLPPEEDFGITLSNRAGMMDNGEFAIKSLSEPLKTPCYYPHYTFFMDYLGDVLMCPHDWGKKIIVGNIYKNSFKEVWASQRMKLLRKKLENGNREFSPCDKCDVKGILMGKEHVKAWNELEKQQKVKCL